MKSNLFTKLQDGDEVANLLPLANPPLSLPNDHSTSDAALFFGGPSSRILLPGWKNLAMAEPMAPIPPGWARLTIVETEK